MNKNNLFLKISVALGYVAMILVNYLANALPIGGVSTGQASDAYANLFTPAGITFSIWGLIYISLLAYTIYQFFPIKNESGFDKEKTFLKINKYYLVTSIANITWIFAWHYGIIWLSVIIMLTLLFFLIKIADIINKQNYSKIDTLLILLPFSLYFGWITVATIANITVFLISISWNGFGIADPTWTIIVLIIGAVIGITRMLKDKNIFYGLVLVWAYGGIWLKHTSISGFNGEYPNIITTIIICIISFLLTISFLKYQKMKKYFLI